MKDRIYTDFANIDTPALLVEKKILKNNIIRMQKLADSNNISLRPHIKTHKTPEIALLQKNAGAKGICCAKIGEADLMASHGFTDILVANIIVGKLKLERLKNLRKKVDKLAVCIDSRASLKMLAESFTCSNIDYMIKVDTGYHRTGCFDKDKILDLAKFSQENKSVNFRGLLTHGGQAYTAPNINEIRDITNHESNFIREITDFLKANGVKPEEVSIGSTPGSQFVAESGQLSELRAGNYVFRDMTQVALATSSIDQCALTVMATVVSVPEPGRAVIDAGNKALNLDSTPKTENTDYKGHGYIIGKKGAVIARLSEEHGIILYKGCNFQIGERVRIIPNHACTVVNLYDYLHIVDNEQLVEKYKIAARGLSQ